MSTANEITRLSNAKSAIAAAINGKGVTVPSGTKLDGMAPFIGQIEQGSELLTSICQFGHSSFKTTAHCTDANGYKKIQAGLDWVEVLSDSIALVEDIPYLYAGGAVMYGGEILGVYYNDDEESASIVVRIDGGMCNLVF